MLSRKMKFVMTWWYFWKYLYNYR